MDGSYFETQDNECIIHEEVNIEDGFLKRTIVTKEFHQHPDTFQPYNKIITREFIDDTLVKENVEYENMEYSFDYYMEKMLRKPEPEPELIEFIDKDEMLL
jgi:hypothetical protein